MATPEDQAREQIDQALEQAGWKVQDYKSANLQTGRGVVLKGFPLVRLRPSLIYMKEPGCGG
jgi:type I restriction enzyme, R subunit